MMLYVQIHIIIILTLIQVRTLHALDVWLSRPNRHIDLSLFLSF
jgi:hypothetical protein